jgi:hypothetical protein
MQFVFVIFREDAHMSSGEIVYVNASIDTLQPTAWSQALREAIVSFEKTPPS